MFHRLNNRDLESDEGFAFKCVHRFYYHYIEGDKVLKIFVEPIKNGLEVIFESQPKWEEPSEKDEITEAKAIQIESRVRESLTFMGIKHIIRKK